MSSGGRDVPRLKTPPPPNLGPLRGPSPQGDGENPRDRANREQLAASDPAVSAFVAASAGSGKTKLLTDRLLRLMLAGEKPERIQCLTFTKAAAAEMAVRLQRTLGSWVTLDDARLEQALRDLAIEPAPDLRRRARALFAQVLDLPGGMRIGTIHAFCQSLLRRFPLEAALSPHFQLVDERDAADALTEAREAMLADANTEDRRAALRALAGLASAEQFGRHVEALQADRQRLALALALPDLAAAQRRALGIAGGSEADILTTGVNWPAEHDLREAARLVHRLGAKICAERAGRMLEWLGLDSETRVENWPQWCTEFLTAAGGARAAGGFVNKAVAEKHPDLAQVFLTEAERVLALIDDCRALAMAELSAALLVLAAPVLQAYAAHKQDSGLVDYDDLVDRTSDLMRDPGAAWVLYKLDGGLDHLLLDEVQDTAPAQWRIAHALTAEFFAGSGARGENNRTVFAVGDRKQSIYSFQGADTDEFDRARDLLERRVTGAGLVFRRTPLDVSFRSTQPVLSLVDAVFDDPVAAAGVVEPGETLMHHADRAAHAGAVELWPLAPLPDAPEPEPWEVAEANHNQLSAPQQLADTLADWIRAQTSGGVMLESRGRPLAPGDVLVLVRRRNAFARALVRALKARGVPVAGLDRLVLTEQPAVQDLMALVDALLLPGDDLNFACLLTSPLGGLDDDDLMALAVGRGKAALFEVLRARAHERPHWQRAWDFFASLLGRADYVAPYALFAEALGPLGGRARLFARLGPEAAEPVDELLNAALVYARLHPPSLQGFLHWLRRSGAEVKREAEAAGNQVRVMTVHGAKGLQAPLVILPDTTAIPPDAGPILWADDPQTRVAVPLFSPRKDFRPVAAQRIRDNLARRRLEEHNRLLYVALTRAEDRLVVCGWQTGRGLPDMCWYNLVARGFDRLSPERETFEIWDGALARVSAPQRAAVQGADQAVSGPPASLPAWISGAPGWRSTPPPAEPGRPARLAPSRPEGVDLGTVPAAASPLAERAASGDRFRRGRLLHALLQHLPDLPEADREIAARRWLDRPGNGLPAGAAATLAVEALAILAHPDLAPAFSPGSRAEVPLTGQIGESVVGGLVDRLAVLPDRVLVVDFKTNRLAPDRPEDTPVMYLRQMASYRAVLRGVFPGREVRCALVWTRVARVAMLPDELLDAHDPGV
ncbi:MAG TPA: double-strand break repair helicase AddA [Acetobacteraceae bacterium]|nr:double-strand break repair helicase AddA [Acetobacteraceae bacterium]